MKAVLFDVFGTVVDWRGSVADEGKAWAEAKGLEIDSARFADLLTEFHIAGLTNDEKDHWNRVWRRLKPWPDSVPGLTRLRTKYTIAPLSNGNIALLTAMAKNAGLRGTLSFPPNSPNITNPTRKPTSPQSAFWN